MTTWDDVRELALALPEVQEAPYYNSAAFKVRGKAFAGVSRHEGAIWVRCDPDERPLLVASSPDAYRLTPHFERSPTYLLVWLEHVDRDELQERLVDAWLVQAPAELAERLA